RHGALLIFDEMLTGFRFSAGGAQALFGVVPDLATFGKALANGYPVSALAGCADVMRLMQDVFFSITYGGETLSLAEALATMSKIQSCAVIDTLYEQGNKVMEGVTRLIAKHNVTHLVKLCGNPTLTFLVFADGPSCSQWEIKALFLQEILQRG